MKIAVLRLVLFVSVLSVCSAAFDPALKKQVEEMWAAENFQGLEEVAEGCRHEKMDVLDQPPRIVYYYSALLGKGIASDDDAAAKLGKFEKWQAAKPYSFTAKIAFADYYITDAWRARGNGWANTVSPENWRIFHKRLVKAQSLLYSPGMEVRLDPTIARLRTILEMAGEHPTAPIRSILPLIRWISLFTPGPMVFSLFQPFAQESNVGIVRHCQEASQWWPNYFPVYEAVMQAMLPRWGGTPRAVALFAEQSADKFPGKLGDVVYARLLMHTMDTEKMEFFQNYNFHAGRMLRGLDVLAAEGEKNWRLYHGQRAAFLAAEAGDAQDARRRIFATGPRTISEAYFNCDEVLPAWKKCGAFSELEKGIDLERSGKLAEAEAFYSNLTPANPNPWIQSFALRNGISRLWTPEYGSPSVDIPVEKATLDQVFELASFHLCAGNFDKMKVYAEVFDSKRGHNVTGKFALACLAALRDDKPTLAELKTKFLSMKTDRANYRCAQDYVSGKESWANLRTSMKPDNYFVQACSIMACYALGEGRIDDAKSIFEGIHRRMPFQPSSAFAESMLWGALYRQFPNALVGSAKNESASLERKF